VARDALTPMLASPGSLADLGDDSRWAFEMKWDGVRALVHVDGGVRLMSRNDVDMSVSYPEITASPPPGLTAVLDGEIVSFDEQGRPSFRRLQKRMHVANAPAARRLAASEPAALLLFDVLVLDGESLLKKPYTERRAVLESLTLDGSGWQVPAVFTGSGADALATSKAHELEGVVAKRLASTYLPGRRSSDWVKIKNVRTQEVVVGGWTPGEGRRQGLIGALLLGIPGPDGLAYVGKVGTGFTEAMLRDLGSDLAPLAATDSPFIDVPRADARGARWVEPTLVGEVTFAEWTGDGRLRHPSWRGLRPDKRPDQVVPES